jgi:DNA modification methylase
VIHAGDCLTVMATLDAESIDAIVTDPPYGIGFMGKAWDGVEIEAAARRDRETRKSLGPETPGHAGRSAVETDQIGLGL